MTGRRVSALQTKRCGCRQFHMQLPWDWNPTKSHTWLREGWLHSYLICLLLCLQKSNAPQAPSNVTPNTCHALSYSQYTSQNVPLWPNVIISMNLSRITSVILPRTAPISWSSPCIAPYVHTPCNEQDHPSSMEHWHCSRCIDRWQQDNRLQR
jgi:hypothetical protein